MFSKTKIFQRLLSLILSGLAIIILLPLLLVLSFLVLIKMGRPVFFFQSRTGLNGRSFKIIKFRTMLSDEAGKKSLEDSERLTNFGRWLRNTSLDELPELFNVLKGDMNLVGPRPFMAEYLSLYSPEQMRRHSVRPGITGWAQISGRNALDWSERFKLDLWYVENLSLKLDLKILCLTIVKVLGREGISADQHMTMPKFTGNKI